MVFGLPPYVSVALFYAILLGGIWWRWPALGGEEQAEVGLAPSQSKQVLST